MVNAIVLHYGVGILANVKTRFVVGVDVVACKRK
jgi:hypothetical protein